MSGQGEPTIPRDVLRVVAEADAAALRAAQDEAAYLRSKLRDISRELYSLADYADPADTDARPKSAPRIPRITGKSWSLGSGIIPRSARREDGSFVWPDIHERRPRRVLFIKGVIVYSGMAVVLLVVWALLSGARP